MKAADILMYLLVFNLVLWLLGGIGFNLYNLGKYKTSIDTDALYQSQNFSSTSDVTSRAEQFLIDIAGVGIAGAVGAIVGAAIIGYLLKAQTSSQGIVYGFFSGVFWFSFLKTTQVFASIFSSFEIAVGIKITLFMTVFFIFMGVSAWVFLFGIMQMVTGGWRYFK
jgi:hypothetical protein